MREILFRAKAINRDKGYHRTNYNNGDWVYGLITRLYDERFENLPAEMTDENGVSGIEIDHNTICQYTGLKDKNGCKIWEGDIVHLFGKDTIGSYDWKAVVEFGNPNSLYSWGYQLKPIGHFEYNTDILCWVCMEEANIYCEVIGNVFDNKELLEN